MLVNRRILFFFSFLKFKLQISFELFPPIYCMMMYKTIYVYYWNKPHVFFFFFFLIIKKFYWYQKGDTLVHRWRTRGQQKLHESRKSRKEENDWFCKVANQSIKVLKKKSLRSSMDLSLSSKHLLFLSLQRHHNKQWRTIMWLNKPHVWLKKSWD